jgi:hypothetical protein
LLGKERKGENKITIIYVIKHRKQIVWAFLGGCKYTIKTYLVFTVLLSFARVSGFFPLESSSFNSALLMHHVRTSMGAFRYHLNACFVIGHFYINVIDKHVSCGFDDNQPSFSANIRQYAVHVIAAVSPIHTGRAISLTTLISLLSVAQFFSS